MNIHTWHIYCNVWVCELVWTDLDCKLMFSKRHNYLLYLQLRHNIFIIYILFPTFDHLHGLNKPIKYEPKKYKTPWWQIKSNISIKMTKQECISYIFWCPNLASPVTLSCFIRLSYLFMLNRHGQKNKALFCPGTGEHCTLCSPCEAWSSISIFI